MNLVSKRGLKFKVIRKAGVWTLVHNHAGRDFVLGSDANLARMLERLEKIGVVGDV